MIGDGIRKVTYVETTDNASRYQNFLYRSLSNQERYEDMQPDSNQPATLYGTAKTHKFQSLEDITVVKLKFRPIIAQTGTSTYNAAKVMQDYFRPLCKNKYSLNETQKPPSILSSVKTLEDGEEDASNDVESLFTNIPLEETINNIVDANLFETDFQKIVDKTY